MNKKPMWSKDVADHDYEAAVAYLGLLFKPKKAGRLSAKMRKAEISEFLAKDILRASDISLSYIKAFDWTKQQEEIEHQDPMSPILIVRQCKGRPLLIADGFHRLCATFVADQEVKVPCKIA